MAKSCWLPAPAGTKTDPRQFARAAVFLASPAVPYMTGVMLPFDGGIYEATL